MEEYTRTDAITVTRYLPETSEISGPSYICTDDRAIFCVDEICGLTGVEWNYLSPGSFIIRQGASPGCMELIADDDFSGGADVSLSAQVQLDGGCSATYSYKNITVYNPGNPPCPDGYVEIEFEPNYDPCRDDNVYYINYITNNPYQEGITTVVPSIVVDVPHHQVKDTINVTVCNVNLCSNKSCCNSYTLYLPPPCEEDPFQTIDTTTNNASVSNGIRNNGVLNRFHEKDYIDVNIFPNPANDRLYIESEVRLSGVVSIFDVQGNKLYEDEFKDSRIEAVDVTNLSFSGVYFIVVRTREYVHSKIITLQR